MTDIDTSLSQSRLDETGDSRDLNGVSGGTFDRSNRSSGSGTADPNGASASRMDASIAYSDVASDRPSKSRSSEAASKRAGSAASSRSSVALSQSNLGTSALGKSEAGDDKSSSDSEEEAEGSDDGTESASVSGSVSGSVAISERSGASKPRASPAPSQRAPSALSGHGGTGTGAGGGSRLASETNFGFADAEDDAASALSARSKSSAAPANSSPSLTSGHGRGIRLASESSLGLGKRASAVGDDDNTSVAPSDRHSSKPNSSPAPSQRSPSGTGGGGSAGSNLGFSGFSMPGGKSTADDADSVTAATDRRSPAPSQQRAPSGSGAGAGGSGSSRKPSGSGGISYDSAVDGDAAAPSSRRRSSFASSLRQSVASHKTASPSSSDDGYGSGGGGGAEADGEATSTAAGLSRSRVDDDAVSSRSGYSAATSKKGSRSGLSGTSGKSGGSAAPSSHTVDSATTRSTGRGKTEDYEEEKFEDEEVADDDDDEEEQQQQRRLSQEEEEEGAAASSSILSEIYVAATSAASRGAASSSKRASSASGGARPASRQSSRGATTAAATSAAGYSQDFDALSNRSPTSGSIAPRGGAAGDNDDDGAASSISAAARGPHGARHMGSASDSIFQAPPSEGNTPSSRGGRGGGGSVFRRLPADAPDDDPAAGPQGLPPRSPSVGGSQAGGDWNEGAVRVAAPGAPRPRHEPSGGPAAAVAGARSRPMSAAPRDRQSALLDGLIRKHPATWDTVDVATWVEFLGLGQYRRRFLHHCIDGRLLLRLNDQQLKSELGIGPMGHRCAILDAAANLIKNYKEAQRDRAAAAADDDDGASDSDGGAGGAPGGRQEYQRSSTAPRARPASARPGALAMPPPPPGSAAARRPASASRSVIPPDPFLGPAMGKVTVYEQRAKLLFELDRAQARAEQHRALADQLKYTATLSSEEVAHIRGLLVDIENKNRAAFEVAGGVDSAARIPWRHVGNGTKHNNWNPERFARPGDPETVDMTFQPRTNPESRKMLGGGDYGENSGAVNSFLDRLNNDLRKREQSRKELEKRYYSDGSHPQTQAEQDFQLVSEQLQSRCHIHVSKDPAEYEGQIDEALEKLRTGESWREAGLRDGPIRAAKGPAKIAALASALRSLSFMERYRSDLKSKSSRMQTLERKWINQTLGSQYLPGGKDKDDLDEAVKFFALLGWRDADGNPSEEAIDTDLLDRLLDRASEYRKRFDSWWERVRDKPEERAAGFRCDVNWFSSPWDADGLGVLMDAEMKRMGDAARGTPGGPGGPGGGMDFVEFTVGLLGKCREDDLRRLLALNPKAKRLGVYRAIRTQKFIEFTQRDLEERDRKLRQAYNALAPSRRKIEPSRIEGFFDRLVEDAAKRRAKAEKMEHDKVQREKEILASSVMYGRLRSAR